MILTKTSIGHDLVVVRRLRAREDLADLQEADGFLDNGFYDGRASFICVQLLFLAVWIIPMTRSRPRDLSMVLEYRTPENIPDTIRFYGTTFTQRMVQGSIRSGGCKFLLETVFARCGV